MAFPDDMTSLAHAIGTQGLKLAFGGTVAMSTGLNRLIDHLYGAMAKLGTGASTASANTVLRGTGSGTTAFGQIVNGDITDGTILNAKINASAAIAVSKLAAMTNKSLLTSNGTTNSASTSPTVSGVFTAEGGVIPGSGTMKLRIVGEGIKATGTSYLICSNSAANHGHVFVTNLSQGKTATFAINGNFNTSELLNGSSTHFSITAATGSKINVFSDGSNYYCQNGWASDQNIQVAYLGPG